MSSLRLVHSVRIPKEDRVKRTLRLHRRVVQLLVILWGFEMVVVYLRSAAEHLEKTGGS
jgi:hypothetical protein